MPALICNGTFKIDTMYFIYWSNFNIFQVWDSPKFANPQNRVLSFAIWAFLWWRSSRAIEILQILQCRLFLTSSQQWGIVLICWNRLLLEKFYLYSSFRCWIFTQVIVFPGKRSVKIQSFAFARLSPIVDFWLIRINWAIWFNYEDEMKLLSLKRFKSHSVSGHEFRLETPASPPIIRLFFFHIPAHTFLKGNLFHWLIRKQKLYLKSFTGWFFLDAKILPWQYQMAVFSFQQKPYVCIRIKFNTKSKVFL